MTTSLKNSLFHLLQLLAFLLVITSVVYGAGRGEVSVLFKKAVRICMECIGLG